MELIHRLLSPRPLWPLIGVVLIVYLVSMKTEQPTTIRYRLVKTMIKPAGWEHETAVPDWEAKWEVVETGQKGTFALHDQDAKWLRGGLSEEEALREADKTMAMAPYLIMSDAKGKVIIERVP